MQRDSRASNDEPVVTVTEITDPTAVNEGIELIDQDAVQLDPQPLRARRVIVRLERAMVSPGGHQFLLDPSFWRPRLEHLLEVPRYLVQKSRADLARPGIEVLELGLKAHDGEALAALLARSAFHRQGRSIRVRLCHDLGTCAIDWRSVEKGATDVVFRHPPDRRLEDRVLDVIRLIEAAASIEQVGLDSVRLCSGLEPLPDEFVLANLLRDRGWI